jgi:hypothetical protein
MCERQDIRDVLMGHLPSVVRAESDWHCAVVVVGVCRRVSGDCVSRRFGRLLAVVHPDSIMGD